MKKLKIITGFDVDNNINVVWLHKNDNNIILNPEDIEKLEKILKNYNPNG